MEATNGNEKNLWRVKVGLAEMLKGGVIMDVTNAEQAKIAEDAGACSVMALERVPSDIRKEGGVARMAAPRVIREIMEVVSIPVMAKVRIGHFAEAQVLEALEVDYIDESEVLTPADEEHHVWKHGFKVPFVCGARNLGEALRRIAEGAAMIRTKGEAGSGNIVEAVRHMRTIISQMKKITTLGEEELVHEAKELGAPLDLVQYVAKNGKLPVPNFSAGGIATPADAALMMQLGAEAVFVGSGIFKSSDPAKRAKAIVQATTHYKDPDLLARVSEELGEAMPGLEISKMAEKDPMQTRGWYSGVTIGVLAVQGDSALHVAALRRGGVELVEARKPAQLGAVDALGSPGGESTTLVKLMDEWKFVPALGGFHDAGKP